MNNRRNPKNDTYRHIKMEEKNKWAIFNPGEIFPAKSEFEIKKEEAYKSTGVFENMYRYDPFIKASTTGLFLTGAIATGAYFAPLLKYSATDLIINSYQSGSTLYNSAAYFYGTTSEVVLEGLINGTFTYIINVILPDIELWTLPASAVSSTWGFVLYVGDNINSEIEKLSKSIDSTKTQKVEKPKIQPNNYPI